MQTRLQNDIRHAKTIHQHWKAQGSVSPTLAQLLIDIAVRNRWPVPATAAAQAKLQGFKVAGLVTK